MQISFSYAHIKDDWNVVKVDGFDTERDPYRFYSLHCYLFPHFDTCKSRRRRWAFLWRNISVKIYRYIEWMWKFTYIHYYLWSNAELIITFTLLNSVWWARNLCSLVKSLISSLFCSFFIIEIPFFISMEFIELPLKLRTWAEHWFNDNLMRFNLHPVGHKTKTQF